MSFVIRSGNLFEVGYFTPGGYWETESRYADQAEAAARCHYLNGGASPDAAFDWEYLAEQGRAVRHVREAQQAILRGRQMKDGASR